MMPVLSYLFFLGVLVSQIITVLFVSNELRLKDVQRTIRTTRAQMVRTVGRSMDIPAEVIQKSMDEYRIFIILMFFLFNVIIVMIFTLVLSQEETSVIITTCLLYLFFTILTSLIVSCIFFYGTSDRAFHYVYVDFFYPSLILM